MSNLFSSLKPNARPNHNVFDKSRRDCYSMKCAMLTPCFVEDTIPEEVLEVQNVNIIRTDSIQSTPFARLSSNVDYHFVPYSQIFHDFERLYYERGEQMRNNSNSSSVVSVNDSVPRFSLAAVLQELVQQYAIVRFSMDVNALIDSWCALIESGSQPTMSGYDFINNSQGAVSSASVSTLRQSKFYFPTAWFSNVDVHNRPAVFDNLRILDMLGYGNHLPAFADSFEKAYKNYVRGVEFPHIGDSGYINTYDTFINDLAVTVILHPNDKANLPWQDFLSDDYSIYSIFNDTYIDGSPLANYQPNVFRLAAYLKVWSDFYRNSQYDVDVNYSYLFNFDYITGAVSPVVPTDKIIKLLQPRYRQWKKDVFTGSYPTAQFGSVAVANLDQPFILTATNAGVSASNSYVRSSSSVFSGALFQSTATAITEQNSSKLKFILDNGISAISIRQAEAMQRYRERILRAGNRLTALQKAVFGDNSRYIENNYSQFINGFKQNIDFNTVSTTAEGNGRNVGELASNGVSTYGGNAFTFHSHDFGVIIGLQYIIPEAEYEAYGLDMMVTKSVSNDFYKPDFQNLGLSPVFHFNFNMFESYSNTSVLGYLARYWEYKTAIDKVHGEFFNEAPLGSHSVIGAFANYVTPRKVLDFGAYNNLPALYIDPRCCDGIFYVSSDVTQKSDQFKVNMSHSVKAILPMSVVGIPSL